MPKKAPNEPQTQVNALKQRQDALEEHIKIMRASGPTTIQAVDTETYQDPVQGEIAIHHPNKKLKYYHEGEWHEPAGGIDSFIYFASDNGASHDQPLFTPQGPLEVTGATGVLYTTDPSVFTLSARGRVRVPTGHRMMLWGQTAKPGAGTSGAYGILIRAYYYTVPGDTFISASSTGYNFFGGWLSNKNDTLSAADALANYQGHTFRGMMISASETDGATTEIMILTNFQSGANGTRNIGSWYMYGIDLGLEPQYDPDAVANNKSQSFTY